MKKVLIYIPSLEGGGAEKTLTVLLKQLAVRYALTVCLTQKTGVFLKDLPAEITVRYLFGEKSRVQVKVFRKIMKYIPSKLLYKYAVRGRYDVEIAFLEGEAVKIISGSRQLSRKIAWVHTNLEVFHWSAKFFLNLQAEKKAYYQFDKIVCVSAESQTGFERLFDIRERSVVINNIVDQEAIIKKSRQEGPKFNRVTVCAAGRLIEVKSFDRLIKAHKKLIDEGYDHDLLILGEGPLRDELEKLIGGLQVWNTVSLPGFKVNPYPYIANCDIYAVSSRVEGFPVVIAEALVLGKPIIATKCSGVSEILAEGKYGLVVDNSEEGLYNGLKDLFKNQALLLYYANMARERAEIFCPEHEIARIEQLFI